MSLFRVVIAAAVFAMLVTTNCFAWNAKGHMVVAEIAWQQLDPESRATLADILRQHPRFADDFEAPMTDELGSVDTETQDHWIFCKAATWPDIARGTEYDRPRWHYINLPVFLDQQQAAGFAGNLMANVSFEYPSTLDPVKFNGVQAVKQSIDLLTSSDTEPEDRAVQLCWLLHVIGDLHQPFHTSALFTTDLFPRGDSGGNKILIRKDGSSSNGQKLHSVWDSLLGRRARFNEVLSKGQSLINKHPREFAMAFVALPNDVWTTEGQLLALDHGYGPLLERIRDAETSGQDLDVIEVPESYFSDAGDLAGRQATIAGARLAGLLKSILSAPQSTTTTIVRSRELGFPAAIARAPSAAVRLGPSRAMGTGTIDAGLVRRVERLESEVRALRAELHSMSGRSPRNALRSSPQAAIHAALEDSGVQCDCGEQE